MIWMTAYSFQVTVNDVMTVKIFKAECHSKNLGDLLND